MRRQLFKKMTQTVLLASATLGLSGCYYLGEDSYYDTGYSSYACDPYAGFDDYYSCDYGHGFANIGFGGGYYDNYYYPGHGIYVFDTYGTRYNMRPHHRRHWAKMRVGHHHRRGEYRGDRRRYRDNQGISREERQARRDRRDRRAERRHNETAEEREARRDRRRDRRDRRAGRRHNPGAVVTAPPVRQRPATRPGRRGGQNQAQRPNRPNRRAMRPVESNNPVRVNRPPPRVKQATPPQAPSIRRSRRGEIKASDLNHD